MRSRQRTKWQARGPLLRRRGAHRARAEPPAIAHFDHVLADVGDGQSLQQSLSTFSGHVRRASRILATATHGSLVLLDEARRLPAHP